MELKEILKLMDEKHFKPDSHKIPALLIYGDGSGMIVSLGSSNIREPIYDVLRNVDFDNLDELIQHLQEK